MLGQTLHCCVRIIPRASTNCWTSDCPLSNQILTCVPVHYLSRSTHLCMERKQFPGSHTFLDSHPGNYVNKVGHMPAKYMHWDQISFASVKCSTQKAPKSAISSGSSALDASYLSSLSKQDLKHFSKVHLLGFASTYFSSILRATKLRSLHWKLTVE